MKYKVRVRLILGGAFGGEVTLELPFMLTHPKPPPSPQLVSGNDHHRTSTTRPPNTSFGNADNVRGAEANRQISNFLEPALDVDLIQLDTDFSHPCVTGHDDDDIVFEDFARLRLKGAGSMDHD